ncbi:MAG: DUF2079 domain-containing protein [Candidatus Omnitrophica bacterium]|nr:DUF2079 domain-containing protein [Candidatus Omnitrophota bacterium]MCM8771265.1 DUF2079 domain-containing protein [Candidatus Omnitrophota bacterium]
MKLRESKFNYNNFLLWFFISIYIFIFSFISVRKYFSFGYYDFDLAVHDLAIWNILHGSIYNSILGIPYLGNHMNLIMFAITPLYAIFNHPIFLLLLQTFILGLAAVPLFYLCKRLLEKNWALIISIIYLFYPALAYTNLYEFHPTVFAPFFIFCMFYYYLNEDFKKFLFFLILTLFCQENMPLAIFMFGVVAFFQKKRKKWIIVPAVLSAAYFIFSLKAISHFNNNTIQFISIYSRWGNTPQEIAKNILLRPNLVLRNIFSPQVLIYLVQLLLPLSFIPLLSPLTFSLAIPFLLQHILSNRISELTIYYHYVAEVMPLLFISFIYGIKFLLRYKFFELNQRVIKVIFLAMFCLTNLLWGPYIHLPQLISKYRIDFLDRQKKNLLQRLPRKASVVATFEFLPHLSHRRNLFSFHHVYYGFYTLSNKKYVLPEDVEYAVIDFNDFLTFRGFYHPQNYRNMQSFFQANNWELLELENDIALFKKGKNSVSEMCSLLGSLSGETFRQIKIEINKSIELAGYNLTQKENKIEVVLYWHCLEETAADINIFFDSLDDAGALTMRMVHPIGYRIYPTNSWRKGNFLKEKIIMTMPDGGHKLKIGFFDFTGRGPLEIRGTVDNLGRAFLGDLK